MSPRPAAPMLPFDPIGLEFPGFTNREIGEQCGVDRRQILRWQRDGIPVSLADRLACLIGRHPLALWGRDWLRAEDAFAPSLEDEARLARNRERDRDRKRRKRAEAWVFMDARWRQWSAQQDRNTVESREQATGGALRSVS